MGHLLVADPSQCHPVGREVAEEGVGSLGHDEVVITIEASMIELGPWAPARLTSEEAINRVAPLQGLDAWTRGQGADREGQRRSVRVLYRQFDSGANRPVWIPRQDHTSWP